METEINQMLNISRHRRQNWTLLSIIGVAVLLVGAIAGSAATAKGWFSSSSNETKVPIYVSSDSKVNEQITLSGGFSAIAKAVTPAVVTIRVENRSRPQQFPFFPDSFRDFFERPDQPNQQPNQQEDEATPRRRTPRTQPVPGPLRPSGVGSGVIVSPDGYIITNNHVVEGAERVKVELADRREIQAKVIGADVPSDIAVIKIDSTNLPTVQFGDSENVEVGDLVLAVGNPLGVGQTVTMGIISAKGRQSPVRDSRTIYEDFLQTDAAINRGNSGGALVNLRGELVGIPSQILSQTGGNIGIGFAIPSKMARNVMDQLIRNGKVRRGKLGVFVEALSPELANQFGYKGSDGAFVQNVPKGDPADLAGVKPGDIITEFNGQRIKDSDQLRNLASSTSPGTTVKFKIWRDGSERELTAKLAENNLGSNTTNQPGTDRSNSNNGVLSGVRVENLTTDLSQNFRGVYVTEVDPESNAALYLQRGDIIESVNRQPINNVNDFNAAMQKADKKEVLLRVHNRNGSRYIVIRSQE
ncbi:MAG: Do family serine endopeptidase [Acidobacteria bacterium]|nr:Do family serine endopeptidase [Acidobacteriota bacterium]